MNVLMKLFCYSPLVLTIHCPTTSSKCRPSACFTSHVGHYIAPVTSNATTTAVTVDPPGVIPCDPHRSLIRASVMPMTSAVAVQRCWKDSDINACDLFISDVTCRPFFEDCSGIVAPYGDTMFQLLEKQTQLSGSLSWCKRQFSRLRACSVVHDRAWGPRFNSRDRQLKLRHHEYQLSRTVGNVCLKNKVLWHIAYKLFAVTCNISGDNW